MSLLATDPEESVLSLPELLAVAEALEREAAERYTELAAHMRAVGNMETAAVFEHLAEEERSHEAGVRHWSEAAVGKAPDPADIRWRDWPETFDEEAAAEMAGSRLVTPYRALSVAVRNEERTFAFWSYVAARAEDAAVRQAAERMAHEELRHVSLLRGERRRAYHAERRHPPDRDREPIRLPEFTAEALGTAAGLARLHAALADALAAAGDPAADLMQRTAEAERADVRDLLSRFPDAERPEADGGRLAEEAGDQPPLALLDLGLKRLEAAVERYFEVAETARDERIVAEAQRLAQASIPRLASLREQRHARAPG